MKKIYYFPVLFILVFISIFAFKGKNTGSISENRNIKGVYRHFIEKLGNFEIWSVDGNVVRRDICNEFQYGGNYEHYLFVPKNEIWIDQAVACEEYQFAVAKQMNEYKLMAKIGMSYKVANDSALRIDISLRRNTYKLCLLHESKLRKVAPVNYSNDKQIPNIPDSIKLENIYRSYFGQQKGLDIWIVDGYMVRKNIFPGFAFSGNEMAYKFIPANEIWIDGQISSEEMEYSIAVEIEQRRLLKADMNYSDAFTEAIKVSTDLRFKTEVLKNQKAPIQLPDTLIRDVGTGSEK